MFSNRIGVGALAVACVAAAGVGGYLASRQNVVPAPAAATAAATPTSTTDAGAARAVQETEAVVATATAPKALQPAQQVAAAPAIPASKRTTPVPGPAANPTAKASTARTTQSAPPLEAPRPSTAQTPAPLPAPAATTADNAPTPTRGEERAAPEQPRPQEPQLQAFEELVVSANSVIGLQTERRISSETAKVEDSVEAHVTRDVRVGGKIAIPAGTRAIGSVMQVDRGGKFKERARLGIRFTTLVLTDGARLPMSTETIYRDGEAPSNGSTAKVGGGAIAGTILGAILGGAKGAAIGAAAGAGGGAAAVEAGERSSVTLPAGSPLTVRLVTPVTVTVEQK